MYIHMCVKKHLWEGLGEDVELLVYGNPQRLGEASRQLSIKHWEGCRESRRCSRDTYPESYTTKYTSIRRLRRWGVSKFLERESREFTTPA